MRIWLDKHYVLDHTHNTNSFLVTQRAHVVALLGMAEFLEFTTKLNLVSALKNMGAIVSAPRTLAHRNHQKSMHAALMLWSWGVFLPSAMLLASLRTKHNVVLGAPGPFWFFAHRSLAYAGVALALAATLIGRAVSTGTPRASSHRLVGYATMLIGLAQPILAYYRPNTAKEKDSTGWLLLHRYLGWVSVALGLANIRLGIRMWNPDDAISSTYNAGLVAAGTLALAYNYKNLPK
eukprot:m.69642 g.69642  ORF g.69642 m.69642 type:complete len:235 (-) comp16037_c0_seq3:23-727(-)